MLHHRNGNSFEVGIQKHDQVYIVYVYIVLYMYIYICICTYTKMYTTAAIYNSNYRARRTTAFSRFAQIETRKMMLTTMQLNLSHHKTGVRLKLNDQDCSLHLRPEIEIVVHSFTDSHVTVQALD